MPNTEEWFVSVPNKKFSQLLTLILCYCASFNGHQTAGHCIKTVVVPAKAAEHQPHAAGKTNAGGIRTTFGWLIRSCHTVMACHNSTCLGPFWIGRIFSVSFVFPIKMNWFIWNFSRISVKFQWSKGCLKVSPCFLYHQTYDIVIGGD